MTREEEAQKNKANDEWRQACDRMYWRAEIASKDAPFAAIQAFKASLKAAIEHELTMIGDDDDDEYNQGRGIAFKSCLELISNCRPKD